MCACLPRAASDMNLAFYAKLALLAIAAVHVALFVTDAALLYSSDAVWHGAYAPLPPGARGSTSYARVIAPSISADACGAAQHQQEGAVPRAWAHGLPMPPPTERDMCLYRRVSVTADEPADPRGMHVFSSGTPYFLLATLQAVMASHLLWSAAPFATLFGKDSAVFTTVADVALALLLLLVWLVLSFASQKHLHVVYNNVLVSVAVLGFAAFLEVSWSWREAMVGGDNGGGEGNSKDDEDKAPSPLFLDPRSYRGTQT
jgi:hypothetical protein